MTSLPALPAGTAARVHRSLDPLHSSVYFSPDQDEQLTAVGLRPGRMTYFASRSAAMGPVTAAVTTATFYGFNPSLVAHNIPRAWTLASVDDILAARMRAVDATLRRLLGDAVDSPEVVEAAGLARRAGDDLPAPGRPLFAAHAALPWPDEPHLLLWQAITVLREFRGDGHIAALVDAGLSGVEALITHCATGYGFTVPAAKATRGWSDDEWAAAEEGLRERGLLDAYGALTDSGTALRRAVEDATDRMAERPWRQLGDEGTARLTELGKSLSRRIAAAGAWPDGVFAAAR